MDAVEFADKFKIPQAYFEYLRWCRRVKVDDFDEYSESDDDDREAICEFKKTFDFVDEIRPDFRKADTSDQNSFDSFYLKMFVLLNVVSKTYKRYLDFDNLKKAIVWSYFRMFKSKLKISVLEILLCEFNILEILDKRIS
jgi:hypothetical protein